MSKESVIIGAFEPVIFPEYMPNDVVKAKIDTGAFTGALHCTKIIEEKLDGRKVLTFSPFDHPEITIKAEEYTTRHVKSSNGDRQKRYFIQTTITIQGETYPITLSLADRSEMKWSVLIGRRFLRQNHFLVDVNKRSRVSLAKG